MYLQQGRLTLCKLCIGPQKGHPRAPGMVLICKNAQASFTWPRVDLARLLRRAYSRPFWITSFEFVKVCGIRFSIWESFVGFYICCYPIITILACLFSVAVRISWKKLQLNEGMAGKMTSRVSYLVYYYCIYSEFEQIITKLRWSIKDNNN